MTCPWCDFEGTPREVHAHLTREHTDHVELSERKERRYYKIACPVCGSTYEREIKPRYKDPEFLKEFREEIAMVGFDMLINHLIVEHEPI